MTTRPHILILAAGSASRMGGTDKLLEPVGGQPLLAHVVRLALAAGAPVTVALPPDRPDRAQALAGLPARQVVADNARAGMSASLSAGLAAMAPGCPVLVMLADMPDLTTDDLRIMLDAAGRHPGQILRGAAQDGTPGHPVVFPASLRPALAALKGDQGARALLERHALRVRLLALPGRNAVTDLDTPADWAAWRARRPETG